MLEVKFDPWIEDCKKPFGAVAVNTSVRFAMEVTGVAVQKVELVIHQENEIAMKIMLHETSAGFFSCDFHTGHKKGLYFYYFLITQRVDGGEKSFFVSRDADAVRMSISESEAFITPYQMTCFEPSGASPDWYKNGICYQIFPDRFFNNRPDGTPLARKKNSFLYMNTADEPFYVRNKKDEIERWDFYGGNLAGILEKLDYLEELGITMLYLNPIFEARSNHRYDTADYLHIDPMLGSDEFFKKFVDTLHQNGIHVILDGVFNHVGKNSIYFNYDGEHDSLGAYQSQDSPYYSWFRFESFPDKYASWWGVEDLPEVDKEMPSFQNFIFGEGNSVIGKWTSYGVDGWRLDVADELPDFFISGIRERLNHFAEKVLIGEVWEDASNKISYDKRRKYILGNSLHGVMNYPFKEAILDLISRGKSPELIANQLMILRENYPKDVFFSNLNNLGTHDTERILTLLGEDLAKLDLAVAALFCLPGIPCIYYGDEAGLTGGKDPTNRKFYPWGNENRDTMAFYRHWIGVRKHDRALTDGELYFGYTEQLLIIIRTLDTEFSLLCLNPCDEEVLLDWKCVKILGKLPVGAENKISTLPEEKMEAVKAKYVHFEL